MKRYWTKDEDKALIRAIKKNPENLAKAFMTVSGKLGRTRAACATRWYTVVSKYYRQDVNDACFAIFSRNKLAINRKTLKEELPAEKRKSWWKKITDFIKAL